MSRMTIGWGGTSGLPVCSIVLAQTLFMSSIVEAGVQADRQTVANIVAYSQNAVRQVLPGSQFQAVTDGRIVKYPGLPQERFQFELCMEGKGLPVRALTDAKR